jgi:hypothetical protein
MHAALSLSASYHTGVDYWVNLSLVELYTWATTARELAAENANAGGRGEQTI